MKQLIEDIAKALVDIPEEVTINEIAGERRLCSNCGWRRATWVR